MLGSGFGSQDHLNQKQDDAKVSFEEQQRTPNQVRFDKMIELNKQQLEHLVVLNKNMAAVSNALFKLLEAKIVEPTVKKAVDKPVKTR